MKFAQRSKPALPYTEPTAEDGAFNHAWHRVCTWGLTRLKQKLRDQGQIEDDNLQQLHVCATSAVFWVCANTVAVLAALGATLTVFFWFVRRRLIFVAPLTVKAAGGYILPEHLQPSLVTIATNGFSAEELVKTVRKQGDFRGDLFVLGDACTPTSHRATYLQAPRKTPIEKEEELKKPGIFFREDHSTDELLSEDAPRQAAKHLKQNIFSTLDRQLATASAARNTGSVQSGAYVGRSPRAFASDRALTEATPFPPRLPQRLLYLDADITVNAPIAPLLSAMGSWDPSCSAYLFRERWYAKSLYNGGAMLLDRDLSAAWLEAWKHELENHPEFPRDQLALSLALHKHPHLKICPLPGFGVSYGADLLQRLRGAHASTFTHWTSAKSTGMSGEGSTLPWAQIVVDTFLPAALRDEDKKSKEPEAKACNSEAVPQTQESNRV